ncbi:hypothetical protein SAMN05444405_10715 [Bacteroides luti]|uniref:DUF5703 domain-containing protein n=1 Tax=Bacteroides luti TaxID=1297750 RepID=A0A1M5AK51_9BACE|nr:DUF5703 domain-containing protein [Bacteroides luti]SHF30545.1 hypothetical protein SAMN05444405_10715 [Bacteroides luti]
MKKAFVAFILLIFISTSRAAKVTDWLDSYNVLWTSQSKGSYDSMPCGGGDIGLNVWVENNELLFYISRSGSLDENNCLLKSGRIRVKLTPNPFINSGFSQQLNLRKGFVDVNAGNTNIRLWVNVFSPVIHVDINSKEKLSAEVYYENWRYKDRPVRKGEGNANSYKWAIPKGLVTKADVIENSTDKVIFYHKNDAQTVFDVTVAQQGMDSVKSKMYNPIGNLTSGGMLFGDNLKFAGTSSGEYAGTDYKSWCMKSVKPSSSHHVLIALHTQQTESLNQWKQGLADIVKGIKSNDDKKRTQAWWNSFWNKSAIRINEKNKDSEAWKIGRNYQLFRYMLGCNAYGSYPTKFNGGLFTFDPARVDSTLNFTPDFRKWGGGTMTAQNQRLVYFPMLKSGDFDMMTSQFDFYLRILKNAELRSKVYWNHEGGCFTEQIENFGLPNPSEYGWKRPANFDKGLEYNAWLEYQWDTVLEFCNMILETKEYNNEKIDKYVPLIESVLTFFDEHYRMLATQRGRKVLDGDGHLVLYPGSACETYKMAYNSTSTISALTVVLEKMIEYSAADSTKSARWKQMLSTIPPITIREENGKKMIAPAKLWERINNIESPQLYPVFPWRVYGVGKKDLDVAVNTYFSDSDALKFRSHIGWKQDNIFAACLGLTKEAQRLTSLKMKDSELRFPTFWGPGYDWTPDHNWGGSGMIGLQEMLMQTNGEQILLFPAWPAEWNVHFKMHAPKNTTVEAELKDGKVTSLQVYPAERMKDVVIMIKK